MLAERLEPDTDITRKHWLIEMPYGRLGAQAVDDKVFVHCDIWEWSPAILKDCKFQWKRFLDHFKKYGVERIYSVIHENDSLVDKWQRLWGMEFVAKHNGCLVFKKELVDGG